MSAIKLAKASKWVELKHLVDTDPSTAQQTDSYGMLPLHWACTEPQSISENVLMSLLKAYPLGARALNTAQMVPLQIAIKAQAKIEWIQALLASYPDAVLRRVPTGENAVELAKKVKLPQRSIMLLEEMYEHVAFNDGSDNEDAIHHDAISNDGDSQYNLKTGPPVSMNARPASSPPVVRPLVRNLSSNSTNTSISNSSGAHPQQTRTHPQSRTNSATTSAESESKIQRPRQGSGATRISGNEGVNTTSQFLDANDPTMQPVVVKRRGSTGPKPAPYQGVTLSSRTAYPLPPRWMNSPSCHICAAKFGTFKKRHHCRNCGHSICSNHCAKDRVQLLHYGLADKHRVCCECFHVLTMSNGQLTNTSAPPYLDHAEPKEIEYRSKPDEINAVSLSSVSFHSHLENRSSNNRSRLLDGHASAPIPQAPLQPNVQLTQIEKPTWNANSSYQQEKPVASQQKPASDTMRSNSNGTADLNSMQDQVMLLQRQVQQLMHEKEMAENQLRHQSQIWESRGQFAPNNSYNANPFNASAPPAPRRQPTYRSYTPMNSSTGMHMLHPSQQVPESEVDPTSSMIRLQDAFTQEDYENEDELHLSAIQHHNGTQIYQQLEYNKEDDEDDESRNASEADVYLNLGISMMEKGSWNAAILAFSRAVEICPDNAILHSNLGKAYYAEGELEKAVDAITRSLALEPSAANSTLLGKILFETGDHERAIEAYQRSLDIQKKV